mmetsp:Transcript_15587/g.22204  ORF Transcript_15587/g.22204 Transcript_15587/m.22204 type:complete len:304 (-) Transcript_15587:203-1114(-)
MSIKENWVSHTPDSISEIKYTVPSEELTPSIEADYLNRPPSPQSDFEKLFLPLQAGEQTTFAKIANRTRRNPSSNSKTSDSIVTDEFATAADNLSDNSDLDEISIEEITQKLYNSDILGLSHSIPEEPELSLDQSCSSTSSYQMSESMIEESVAATTTPPNSTPHFDVVGHVYEGVKSAWAFGKDVIVFRPFMGAAECVAGKVLNITTGVESLDAADRNIKPHLEGIDKDILDPAIIKLWSLISPIVGKGDEVVKSMIFLVLRKQVEASKPAEPDTVEEKEPLDKVNEDVYSPEISTPIAAAH